MIKYKNLIMAFSGAAFAIGSAFASILAPESVYVIAKADSDPETPYICTNTGVQCNLSGTGLCQVRIVTSGPSGTIVAATVGSTYRTYRSGCAAIISNTTSGIMDSSIVPYAVLA